MPIKSRFSCLRRSLFAALLLLCSASACLCVAAADDTYSGLVSAATQFRQDGRLAEARQMATSATLLAPDRFEAWFLAGAVAHEQHADADARPLLEKALALAPAAAKAEIQRLLATLDSGGAPPAAAVAIASPPAATDSPGPPALDAAAAHELDALMLIPQEAAAADSSSWRQQLLGEFLKKSASFGREHPEQTALWVARAEAAMELNLSDPAREAAQQLLATANPGDQAQKALALLERRGWTDTTVTPASFVIADLRLKMVGIPAGSFTMGSPDGEPGRLPREAQFQVTLSRPFWLGRTTVTQAQWHTIMGNSNPSGFIGATRPVETVSWDEAMDFCQRLTKRELSAKRLPTGYQYTLPTEAQWEYACRAGTTGPYAGRLDDMAWYVVNSGNMTHAVGTKEPNGWGLYDMQGNVWQWCLDHYGDYPVGSVTDPTGPSSGPYRVFRGGSWNFDASYCRPAYRYYYTPGYRNSVIGFRVALAAG